MPVILEDDMLIPPSMRRPKRYYGINETVVSSPSSSSTIELPPHRSLTPPRSPLIIHEDHYVPVYEDVTREYIINPANSSHHRRGTEIDLEFTSSGLKGAHYIRARSVGPSGYDSYDSSYSDDYYLEDGTRHGGRRYRHGSPGRYSHRRNHRGRHFAEGGSGLFGPHEAHRHRRHRSHSHHRSLPRGAEYPNRLRHLAQAGLAAAGLKHATNHHRQRSHSRGRRGSDGAIYSSREHHSGWYDDNHRDHRRAKHLAEAGLGLAAAGAAKELYDHRKRAQRRRGSSASSISSSEAKRNDSHYGRHVAAAALGATAAGLAHHKLHHNTRRSASVSSYSSDEERHSHHRGRGVASAALGAAAGLAGKALHDHYRRSRSRSRSSSSSSNGGRHRRHHSKLPAAALGTAAALAAAKHHHDKKHGSPSRSRSRKLSHPGIVPAAGYMMAGALAERHHRKKHHEGEKHHGHGQHRRSISADGHREHRHRRSSVSSGNLTNESHQRTRRGSTAGGLGGIVSNMMGSGRNSNVHEQVVPPPHRGIGEKVAYRIGEAVAEELADRRRR